MINQIRSEQFIQSRRNEWQGIAFAQNNRNGLSEGDGIGIKSDGVYGRSKCVYLR